MRRQRPGVPGSVPQAANLRSDRLTPGILTRERYSRITTNEIASGISSVRFALRTCVACACVGIIIMTPRRRRQGKPITCRLLPVMPQTIINWTYGFFCGPIEKLSNKRRS